jgi:bisphosphoglycerate-independent phosphoglycerate mutase (AlkP superfamily)
MGNSEVGHLNIGAGRVLYQVYINNIYINNNIYTHRNCTKKYLNIV